MGQRRGFLVDCYFGRLSAASAGRRQPDRSPNVARPRPRRARARDTGTPLNIGCRERAPAGVDSFGRKLGESHLGTTGRADGLGLLLLRGGACALILWVVSGEHEQKGQQWLVDVSLHRQRVFGPSARPKTPTARVSAERGVQKFYRLVKFARGDGAAETGADGHAPQRGRGKRRGLLGTWQRASCWRWSGG